MPFGHGHHDDPPVVPPPNAVSATALVTATEEPLEEVSLRNPSSFASTQILVDAGAGPVVGYQRLPLDVHHWLTVGMTIPVFIDPANPNGYVIDWPNVPSIEDRVAAKEPTLVDPMAARLQAWDALAKAGFHEPDLNQVAPQLLQSEMAGMRANLVAEPEAFAKQLAGVGSVAAPEGYQRALVVIATTSASWSQHFLDDVPRREVVGNHTMVLAVSVPGSNPYPLLKEKFDHESRQYDPNNPGLPAVVSITDPTDVWIQWDEMPKSGQAIPSAATEAAAVASVSANPPPVSIAGPPDTMKAMLTAQANASLARMAPAARPATIAYYKAMGVEIDPSLMP
jgi:hypothetical protein